MVWLLSPSATHLDASFIDATIVPISVGNGDSLPCLAAAFWTVVSEPIAVDNSSTNTNVICYAC